MNRKNFLKLFGGFTAAASLTGLYAWQVEPYWLEFVEQKMPIKNLPDNLAGKTLMQISDLHVGNRASHTHLINSLIKAKAYQPDFVVYTGDYITLDDGKIVDDKLDEVISHFVKGKLGTVGILGNHDFGVNWNDPAMADSIAARLEAAGVTMLRNTQKEIAGLNFIGIDDFWGTNFRPENIMPFFERSKANLVLSHNPDTCDLDIWNGYNGWILSGHTHGGQCKPPFLPAPIVPVQNKKYTQGFFELGQGRKLYINRALGCSWQVRFNVRPEITIFTLEREV
jgi:hypothetical protein